MDRGNHYEIAFEAFLRAKRLGYIAVDETHRPELDQEPIKNLDFLVMRPDGGQLLIDVKGRRFPYGPKSKPRKVWECWAMRDDVDGLLRWEERLGPHSVGLLVFTYWILPTVTLPEDTPDLWSWRGRHYLFRAVEVTPYHAKMRVRSTSWRTVALTGDDFRAMVRPFSDYLLNTQPIPCLLEESSS